MALPQDWEMDLDDEDDDEYVPEPMDEEEEDLEEQLEEQLERESQNDEPDGGIRIGAILRNLMELNALSGQDDVRSVQTDADTAGVRIVSLEQLLSRVGGFRLTRSTTGGAASRFVPALDDDDEEEEDDDEVPVYYGGRRSTSSKWFKPVTEPQDAGVELIAGGAYGRVRHKLHARAGQRNISRQLLSRASNPRRSYREDLAGHLVPNSKGTAVASYEHNIYCGQFSTDSSFYYTCCQDFQLHVYDMTAPPQNVELHRVERVAGRRRRLPPHESPTTLKELKTIKGNAGQWTITDSHLSPDNERIIYSSITPIVYMATTLDSSTQQTAINFADTRRRQSLWGYDEGFGIWSCRFSADGNEVIAGGSGKIFVYDLLADKRTVKIEAHADDVNSCCWADTASGNVLISASDDTFLKVWDRRSLGSSRKPSGVLIGHTEGITNVSAKGDGRYIISNGKDQALRLWDLRMMRTNAEYESVKREDYGIPNFDYRYSHYPKPRYLEHPKDCSVMTYRGHSVMQTLIRCHFSPAETTGGQYIYSGSADGKIHIWSLDGQIVQVLDRSQTLPMSFDPSGPEPEDTEGTRGTVCVRDVSWHSREPVLMSAGWESGRGGSMVARHEWKGLSKMPGSAPLQDYVAKHNLEREETSARRRVPGQFESEEDSE